MKYKEMTYGFTNQIIPYHPEHLEITVTFEESGNFDNDILKAHFEELKSKVLNLLKVDPKKITEIKNIIDENKEF